jgi:hypothetical protein
VQQLAGMPALIAGWASRAVPEVHPPPRAAQAANDQRRDRLVGRPAGDKSRAVTHAAGSKASAPASSRSSPSTRRATHASGPRRPAPASRVA